VVELAGMLEKCDFFEQESVEAEGRRLRPDLIVRLPGGKNVVIDAKTPLSGFLEAMEATTEPERVSRLKDHARLVRDRIADLAQKSYWDQFQPAPEFVVLFLPGESFFSAALEQDPGLIELGAEVKVVLATPTTLIALLKAVAYGWRQEAIAENARLIASLGEELHRRLATLAGHFTRLGKQLSEAVGAYNQAVGSLESRVLVTGRRFKELGLGANSEIPRAEPVLEETRELSASELTAAAEDPGSGNVPRPGDVFPTEG
jgi:DNA recombination protein RmuC